MNSFCPLSPPRPAGRREPGVLLAEFSYDALSGQFRFERQSSPWVATADDACRLFEVLEAATQAIRDKEMRTLVVPLPPAVAGGPSEDALSEEPPLKRPHL